MQDFCAGSDLLSFMWPVNCDKYIALSLDILADIYPVHTPHVQVVSSSFCVIINFLMS